MLLMDAGTDDDLDSGLDAITFDVMTLVDKLIWCKPSQPTASTGIHRTGGFRLLEKLGSRLLMMLASG